MLRSDHQLAVKRAFRWTAIERFFRGKLRQIGIVIFLREMREHEIARTRVKTFGIGKVFADGMIREVPGAAEHALLDYPGIRPDLEHIQIVIGFEQQTVRVAQMHFDKFRHVAEVRHDGHLRSVGAEREADRVGGIVWNLERVNIDVADGEVLARLNRLEAVQPLSERVGQDAAKRIHCGLGNVKRSLPKAEHLRQAVAVVGMLVRDEDAVDAVDAQLDGREPRQRFALAEAAVHEESGAPGLEQSDIARAA